MEIGISMGDLSFLQLKSFKSFVFSCRYILGFAISLESDDELCFAETLLQRTIFEKEKGKIQFEAKIEPYPVSKYIQHT